MTVSEDRALVLFEPKPNNIYNFDALQLLRLMPSESVNCIVTSPPYYGLRDYGADGQIGLEETPEQYVAALVAVFREARRVLRDDGTLFLNLGDSYASFKGQSGSQGAEHQEMRNKNHRSLNRGYQTLGGKKQTRPTDNCAALREMGLKPKDLIGIPWRVAFALQADGWYLRSDIIWAKGNPMPESVTDRPTKAHEYVFLLSKSPRYWYDAEAIKEPIAEATIGRMERGVSDHHKNIDGAPGQRPHSMNKPRPHAKQDALGKRTYTGFNDRFFGGSAIQKRNKRSVWTINTQPIAAAHFAVMPEALVEPCLLAGCPAKVCAECGAPWERVIEREVSFESGSGKSGNKPNGKWSGYAHAETGSYDLRMGPVVRSTTLGFRPTCDCHADTRPGLAYDPFMGAGTVALVAQRHGRNYLGSELNPEYVELARMRVAGRLDEYLAKQRGEPVTAYMFEGGAA